MIMQHFNVLLICSLITKSLCFSTPTIVRPPVTTDVLDTKAFKETTTANGILQTKDVVTNIVVAGATGRTGRYVVEELINRGVSNVIALVRNVDKAKEVYTTIPSNLQIVECNFSNETQISDIISSMQIDAAIWCATGFTDTATVPKPVTISFIDQLKRTFGLPVSTSPVFVSDTKQQSIDLIGLPAIAKSLVKQQKQSTIAATELPKVVMCSSAGVTRTIWDETKKQKYIGAADIPIVRLNPFNILDRKRESEEIVRQGTTKYCIVRPCGLNDNWPMNSRPIFTQGDVAVGRLHRKDLAKVLVDVLTTPEATDKTFEVVGLANYPPSSVGIGPALKRLYTDTELATSVPADDTILSATYNVMQQLLPGETQDAAALAMGQTYEQLDTGTVGRFGVRGQENINGATTRT